MEARYRRIPKGYEFMFPQGHVLGWVGADNRFYWSGEEVSQEIRDAPTLVETIVFYAKFIGYQVPKHPIWVKPEPALTEEERERRQRAVKAVWAEARREGEATLPTKPEIQRLQQEAKQILAPSFRIGRWRPSHYQDTYQKIRIYDPVAQGLAARVIEARPIKIGNGTKIASLEPFQVELQSREGPLFLVDPRAVILSAEGELLYNGRALRIPEHRVWFQEHPEWPPDALIEGGGGSIPIT
jgi:hypothetical protein